jgi:hypothetical protein
MNAWEHGRRATSAYLQDGKNFLPFLGSSEGRALCRRGCQLGAVLMAAEESLALGKPHSSHASQLEPSCRNEPGTQPEVLLVLGPE